MILAIGGCMFGPTSAKSRSFSRASLSASKVFIGPSCFPSSSITWTSTAFIWLFILNLFNKVMSYSNMVIAKRKGLLAYEVMQGCKRYGLVVYYVNHGKQVLRQGFNHVYHLSRRRRNTRLFYWCKWNVPESISLRCRSFSNPNHVNKSDCNPFSDINTDAYSDTGCLNTDTKSHSFNLWHLWISNF